MRGALYDAGWLAASRAPVPVISVGNLTAGGSGKSPMVAWIAAQLSSAGKRPAIVSRGYRGSHRGAATIVSSGEGLRVTADVAGDEPVMLAAKLPRVPVVVARRRLDGARLAVDSCGADCVILDDGFQHRALAREMDLVMVDGVDPFGSGRLLPAGPLREPMAALRRASVIVVHRGSGTDGPDSAIHDAAARHCPRAPVLRARVKATQVLDAATGESLPVTALQDLPVACLAGIARPGRFFEDARKAGARVVKEIPFPDHHAFSEAELDDVARTARGAGAAAILTTEKDLVRLHEGQAARLGRLLALCVELEVVESDLLARLLREAAR